MHREPRGIQGRQKLRNVVDTARRIVLARGLDSAKMAEIAAEAKISTATLYAYYPSKDRLFQAIVEAAVSDIDVRLSIDSQRLPGDPIKTLALAFLDRLNDPDIRALVRIMTIEGARFPAVRAYFDAHTRLYGHTVAVELFERLAAEGRFEAGAAEVASRQLLGMLEHETIMLRVFEGEAYQVRDSQEIASDAALTMWARFGRDKHTPPASTAVGRAG